MDLVFIGDRPAQMCAMVLDAPLKYTGDKLDPFAVYRCVELYVTDRNTATAYRITQRHIVLSTGLTWAPKYDGVAVKQINTLLQESFVTPIIFVLPVSSRILLGHAINAKLQDLCRSSRSRQDHTRFLGDYRLLAAASPRIGVRGSLGGAASAYGFAGDAAHPTQPTPTEVLALLQVIQVLGKS